MFAFRLIEDETEPLNPNRNITTFQIILYDFMMTLFGEGSEVVTLGFVNDSMFTDLAGNELNKVWPRGELSPFVFVSAEEEEALAGGGESLKYTIMTVFSFNILIKVVLKSSMQDLWSLVHAL